MSITNHQHLPEESQARLSDQNECRNTEISSDLLSPEEVAKRLGVCVKTATSIMKELPHISISKNMYSGKKRIRITEKTFSDFKDGVISRKRLRRAS